MRMLGVRQALSRLNRPEPGADEAGCLPASSSHRSRARCCPAATPLATRWTQESSPPLCNRSSAACSRALAISATHSAVRPGQVAGSAGSTRAGSATPLTNGALMSVGPEYQYAKPSAFALIVHRTVPNSADSVLRDRAVSRARRRAWLSCHHSTATKAMRKNSMPATLGAPCDMCAFQQGARMRRR